MKRQSSESFNPITSLSTLVSWASSFSNILWCDCIDPDKNSFFFVNIEPLFSCTVDYLTDESALRLNDVDHIPQTAASHHYIPAKKQDETIDMKREDPRDTFYKGEKLVSHDCPSVSQFDYFIWICKVIMCQTLFLGSAFDQWHVFTRDFARLSLQAHLLHERPNSAPLPRNKALCKFFKSRKIQNDSSKCIHLP